MQPNQPLTDYLTELETHAAQFRSQADLARSCGQIETFRQYAIRAGMMRMSAALCRAHFGAAAQVKRVRRTTPTAPARWFIDQVSRQRDPQKRKVLRSFVRFGRLHRIPASRTKRRVVLEVLAERFLAGQPYPEQEVNDLLKQVHPDFCSLRRYLVDEGLLRRVAGIYYRS